MELAKGNLIFWKESSILHSKQENKEEIHSTRERSSVAQWNKL
jgi:hypothetical protein